MRIPITARARGKIDVWYRQLLHALSGVASGWWIIACTTLVSGSYYAFRVQPIEEAGRQLRHDASLLAISQKPNEVETTSPASRLADFYAGVPRLQDLPDAMQKIYDAVQTEGLTQEQATYKLVRDPGDRFVRYEMVLPLRGAYPQVKRFLGKVTAALPTLAVEHVQLSRVQAADATVECRLSMTIHLIDGLPER